MIDKENPVNLNRLQLNAFSFDARLTPDETGIGFETADGRALHLIWAVDAGQWQLVDADDTVLLAGDESDALLYEALGDPQPLAISPLHASIIAQAGLHPICRQFAASETDAVGDLFGWGLVAHGRHGVRLTDAGVEVAEALRQQRERGEWQ